jgi:hypothetical protein
MILDRLDANQSKAWKLAGHQLLPRKSPDVKASASLQTTVHSADGQRSPWPIADLS